MFWYTGHVGNLNFGLVEGEPYKPSQPGIANSLVPQYFQYTQERGGARDPMLCDLCRLGRKGACM